LKYESSLSDTDLHPDGAGCRHQQLRNFQKQKMRLSELGTPYGPPTTQTGSLIKINPIIPLQINHMQ
jgi:hypothetical protein